jgi:hypothetical protein
MERDTPVHLVLPFGASRFRKESVADRGDRWLRSFNAAVATVRAAGPADNAGSLIVRDHRPGFSAGNDDLIERACALAPRRVLAVAVRPRHREDPPSVTDDFVQRAEDAGLFVVEIDPLAG